MKNVFPILFFLIFLCASQVTAQVTVLLGVVPSVGTAGQSLEVVIKGLAIRL